MLSTALKGNAADEGSASGGGAGGGVQVTGGESAAGIKFLCDSSRHSA